MHEHIRFHAIEVYQPTGQENLKNMVEIINRQKKWAEDNDIKLRDEEHTLDVYSNLYGHCLYHDFEDDIKQGNGNELYDHDGHPAKMSSLRSSSALCVNVFAPQDLVGYPKTKKSRTTHVFDEDLSGTQYPVADIMLYISSII